MSIIKFAKWLVQFTALEPKEETEIYARLVVKDRRVKILFLNTHCRAAK